ncbi:restriction system-associated AAA family ATPase [Pseudoalteromonas piscicida]|uniref:ABC transporter n=1 Tax=Pseudoalteromonas piscicida TaxID=43662 RepID=A0AAD0RH16_PSEO7|nr:restriction system-associated AAA family ATPase [Pseudoalteromonas piscicida]ASD67860.1 ABC transporter [Pseudoalteromonas piscicida]AXR01435.1 ABC transporter [Pseudoalteromonas piscicida]
MKLVRLKINDPRGFRSLPSGFEHHFRSKQTLQEELANTNSFAPFVCAGPNGSGKSNLLEVLAAIFYQLEIQRVRRSFLPEALQGDEQYLSPTAFELDYLIRVPKEYRRPDSPEWAKVSVWKEADETVRFTWENQGEFDTNINEVFGSGYADIILPQYILGYSSGENEILSLPFFKMRFIQFDEYWNALIQQLSYPGYPETRMAYMDNSFSQAILLCNLLFQDDDTLQPFGEDVGIEALKEFRIILRRRIELTAEQFEAFALENEKSVDAVTKRNGALSSFYDEEEQRERYYLNLLYNIDKTEGSNEKIDPILERLRRCATLNYEDDSDDTLILDYWVNDATKQAFRENFSNDPLTLFQAFQVLLALNLYTVNDKLKADLYQSSSHYVSETVPTLASDERIMRFKNFYFTKQGVDQPMLLKELSDGEHQLLHSLGLCLLFRNTNSLFLLDEPETHFNPDWRANFISRLRQCFLKDGNASQEMLITTHSPFLISDSQQDKVLVFDKDKVMRKVSIQKPEYNTLGASINLITMETFNKQETIGAYAKDILKHLLSSEFKETEPHKLAKLIIDTLGDSIERSIAIQEVLARGEQTNHSNKGD